MSATAARRVRVKICGITNPADADDAVALGADALGFNVYAGSKRFIDLEKARGWIRELPPFVMKVAVMVNPSIAEAEAVFKMPFIDMVQFHGNEEPEFCAHFARLGLPFIKAVAVRDAASLENLSRFGTRDILADAFVPGEFGGTGRMIDAGLQENFSAVGGSGLRLILSGGLKPDNVGAAITRARPYAVDVASGVESAPGRKDRRLVEEFIAAVRAEDDGGILNNR
jgi:phosphoribosylanthranilate isomerase